MKNVISYIICICLFSCNKNTDKFELCPGKKWPYYHPTLKYQGGFYEIKKHYYNNYKSIDSPSNTGIVKISFNINCEGQSGNYLIETYSLKYNNVSISKKITKQLLDLTKTLIYWIPASNEDGDTVNSHKFFAFKIVNGKLTDILPR
jgi:hypothetical protein